MTTESSQYFSKLLKIAQDMAEAVAPAQEGEQKAGPEEVLQALEQVISELESIASAIPADRAAPRGAEPSPEQKEVTAKLAEANQKIAAFEEKISKDERVKIAQTYSELFDTKIAQQKYDDVMNSKDSNESWAAKIESIVDYQQSTGQVQYKPAKNFSYTRVAKGSAPESLYIL